MRKTFTQKFWAKHSKKGFTLVELVMAIAILAVIAAIAIPVVSSVIKTANQNTDINNGKTVDLLVKEAYTEYKAGIGEYAKDTTAPTVAKVLYDQGLASILEGNSKEAKEFIYKTAKYKEADQVKFYYDNKGAISAYTTEEMPTGLTELTPNLSIEAVCEPDAEAE